MNATQTEDAYLQIDLSREDAAALENAALAAKMTTRDFGKAILERAVEKPLERIVETPSPEGKEWSGNRWPVGMDDFLWKSARAAAKRHRLTVKQWAYAAIVEELYGGKGPSGQAAALVTVDFTRFTHEERAQIDQHAKVRGISREEMIRQSIVDGLRKLKGVVTT